MGDAPHEVGGAVQRVYDPAVVRILAAAQPGLFAEDGVVGVGFVQVVDNLLFRRDIHIGNEVVHALGPHFKTLQIIGGAHDVFTRLAGGA